MLNFFRALLAVFCLGMLTSERSSAQFLDDLTQAYTDSLCTYCAEWNVPQDPFRIHHNTYYVGTRGLSAVLITSEDGHVLIDGALPNSAPLILESIRSLGFEPKDVELILNSHVHYDHAGGLAALQHATGARMAASSESAPVLERGRGGPEDPQYGMLLDFPPVSDVERFEPGDTLHAGSLAIVSHETAGHTPGGTTWSWQSCEQGGCLEIVYADSQTPVSAPGFRYTDSVSYPDAIEDFERGHRTLEQLQCDILITTHPSATSLWERVESGVDGLIDRDACKQYAAYARKQLKERIRNEQQGTVE